MRIQELIFAFLMLVYGPAFGFLFDKDTPQAKNGIIDLRKQNFSEIIPLDGEWKFYWKQLINPNQIPKEEGMFVSFPSRWNDLKINGQKLPSFGYATYKLTVLLPPNRTLTIAMPDVYSSYKLFFNNKEVSSNGKIATSEKDYLPYWEYRSIDIPGGLDTLNLTLQIANFSHSQGGIKKQLQIGFKQTVELRRHRDEAIDLLLTGCLFMGGLFFFSLYLLGNRDKSILYFSLFCLVYSYRVAGVDSYVLHTIIPNINWQITIRLEYITFFTGIGLFGMYSRFLYPRDANKKLLNLILIICCSFAFATLLLPPLYFTRLISPFLVIVLICLFYIPYLYVRAYKKGRPGSIYSLVSSLSLLMVFSISLFHYWGLIPPFRGLSFTGYISFFFLQSLVLSHRVSFALNKARKQAEQGLLAKSEFLSTMSHEIRTPLNSVIGLSHLLLKDNPRPDQEEQLEVMLFSANNLLSIVNDILDYTKIEAGKIVFEHIEMDVNHIVGNIVKGLQTFAQDKGIELTLDSDPNLKNQVFGDPTRLYQVITNLLHNAIKFTKHGSVKVGIEIKDQINDSITLRFYVKDTGIGISAEKQKLIFERFTQADSTISRGFGGTGLGLAICKRILELQSSFLGLKSEAGKGSTFFFSQTLKKSSYLPGQNRKVNFMPTKDETPLSGISLLLVEDNQMNVMVAKTFLQRWGATVDVAVNGREALNVLDINRHKLILMDLHMPVMDGFESSKIMRSNGVTLPIVALTANLLVEIEEQMKTSGINDIIVKPFLPHDLFHKVQQYVLLEEVLDSTNKGQ